MPNIGSPAGGDDDGGGGDTRNALLAAIQKGSSLKKIDPDDVKTKRRATIANPKVTSLVATCKHASTALRVHTSTAHACTLGQWSSEAMEQEGAVMPVQSPPTSSLALP